MSTIYDWSTTAGNNGNSDSAINFAENQVPSTVNNAARALMGRVAEFVDDIGGTLTAGGTANALTLTTNSAFTAYADGLMVAFKASADNTTATTLSVNGIGVKAIRKMTSAGEAGLDAADIKNGYTYSVRYSTTANSAAGAWLLDWAPKLDTSAFVTLTGTQTLTNKTLTSPFLTTPRINDTSADHRYIFQVNELAADRFVALPALTGNDTFVFTDHTQTLTNKTLTAPTITGLDASTTAKGLVELATAAEVATGTDTTRAPHVAAMGSHQGMAKAWVLFASTGVIQDSYGVSSVGHPSTGIYNINFSTAFVSANYAPAAMVVGAVPLIALVTSRTTTQLQITLTTDGGVLTDSAGSVIVFGDQ